jgi:EAL domain-containing protein (putative c-di-GMP-specific phosphodiesterase class I)
MVENMACANNLRLLGVIQKPVKREALLGLLELLAANNPLDRPPEFQLEENEMRRGLATALLPYYQPQVDIRTRKVIGVEALARWRHPEYGILSPSVFINLAEKTGLILQLTDLMLAMSMRQWVLWRKQGIDLQVSVNVSMDCLSRIDFPEQIVSEAKACDFPLSRLMLEITESRLMQDLAVSLDVLSRLCLKRVQLSIDDFGTAYSNLEKLQMLPFAELKIDRSFVYGAAQHALKRTILESSAALGKRLDMQIIAEGVESQADWDCAAMAGCDVVQGYFVARPMPGNELEDWLRDWEYRNNASRL